MLSMWRNPYMCGSASGLGAERRFLYRIPSLVLPGADGGSGIPSQVSKADSMHKPQTAQNAGTVCQA